MLFIGLAEYFSAGCLIGSEMITKAGIKKLMDYVRQRSRREGEMITKGEWIVYGGHNGGFDRPLILAFDKANRPRKCIARLVEGKPEEVNANAHLIAAAPDMYEALKIVLPWAKEWIRYLRNTVGQGQGQNADEQFVIADKALAKAEGREE